MKRSFPLALLLAILAISISHAHLSAPPEMLYIYNAENLPIDVKPLYISGDSVLAFGSKLTEDGFPGNLLSLSSFDGEFFIIKFRDRKNFSLLTDSSKYVVIGDAVVFKASPEIAEQLSKFGWGLTRLVPVEKTAPPSGITYPVISTADSEIVRMISFITPESSRQLIADLSAIATRYSFTQGCRQAEQYAFDKFDSLGLTPAFFNYQYSSTNMRDVIGQLDGIAHPESVIIVCAHLDCTSETPDRLAPGAEDNGTGTTVVLEAARVLSQQQMNLTIRFVLFSGEEQGLIGSDRYAAFVQAQGERVAAVINVDMVGYSGLYAQDMHIFSDPGSYTLGTLGAEVLANYTTLDTVPHYGSSPQYGSDHYPFAIRGYPSIFFIDAWRGFDWYPYYHTVADTLGNINLNQQSAIGQAVAAMAATLARPHVAQSYLPGDANGSGDVNGLDVVYLLSYLKGTGPMPDPLLRADANGDCITNGLDVVYLVNYLKGGLLPIQGNCE